LTHIHYDLFEMLIKLAEYKAKVSFTTGENGAIESVAANLEPTVKAIVFTRVASKEAPAENTPTEKE
jgi:hypothetical protein